MTEEQNKAEEWSPYHARRALVISLALLGLVIGLLETITVIAIVAVLDGATQDVAPIREVSWGPLDLSLGPSELLLIATITLATMTMGQVLTAWARARAMANWQLESQNAALVRYMRTAWPTQAAETTGSLQTLVNLSWGSARGLGGAIDFASSIATVLVFTAVAFIASPIAASVLLVAGAVLLIVLRPLRAAAQSASGESTHAQRRVADSVSEIRELANEIRLNQAVPAMTEQIDIEGNDLRSSRQRSEFLSLLGTVFYRSLGLGLVLATMYFASRSADLDVTRLGVAGLLLLRGLGYGQRTQQALQRIQNARPYVEQVAAKIGEYERNVPVRGDENPAILGRLELLDVNYQYSDEAYALSAIDLKIEPGEMLGVVGPSGGGKTTLAQILLGLRTPSTGSYLVDSREATKISESTWFNLVSAVAQEPQVLRASLFENVAFHRRNVSRSMASDAMNAAGLDVTASEFTDGIDTCIGEGIRELSGGQRQRLGIARALAGSPQLLVLDEPTSALDALSESTIQETLRSIKGDVTVVIIAHRIATLNDCDRILVLENGEMTALGPPEKVMAENSFYRQAARLQSAGPGSVTD